MLRKKNLNNLGLFSTNLDLACRYSHLGLFDYLTSSGGKKMMLIGKERHLISQLLTGFDIDKNSHLILNKILDYSIKQSYVKPKLIPPSPSSYGKNIDCIAEGMIYILQNEELRNRFCVDQ